MMCIKLPWELVEEILYRVQTLSLIRFKVVCKQWNKLFESKSFINNHLVHARPQFLLWTNDFKMYSANVTLNDDPKIEVCELPFAIPFLSKCSISDFIPCDGLLYCNSFYYDEAAVLNPWLRQTRLIKSREQHFMFHAIGYDSEKSLKIFGLRGCSYGKTQSEDISVGIYKFQTNEWNHKCLTVPVQDEVNIFVNVSLNGNLYWIIENYETDKYFIRSFDFSKEIYKEVFCVLPWDMTTYVLCPILSIFRKNRFSVLTGITEASNMEIWITENKINIDDGENVAWMKFMTFSVPVNWYYSISYFIDNVHKNCLVLCCKDENRKLCIYIVRGNAVKKIHLGLDDAEHCTYVPSLVSVP